MLFRDAETLREILLFIWKRLHSERTAGISTQPSPLELHDISKDATPDLANSLFARGINIGDAAGPRGESAWHTAVEHQQNPDIMFTWLLKHSGVPSFDSAQFGCTPLMHAVNLDRIDAVLWLAQHSPLETQFSAAECAAKRHTKQSVAILEIIMANLPPFQKSVDSSTKRLIHAVKDGLFAEKRRLDIKKLRHAKVKLSNALEHEKNVRDAEHNAFTKMRFVASYMGIWIPLGNEHLRPAS
ncbi:uncharacterized protein N7446_010687 [Penicillium canescens]|uniref:Uncharacterized protein n=1 Tax=Penicillium canescens TaxID=5083 RepID=A0AAD6IB69_PENCN|nr:uncharacterized protein N7446_010687 [Penicillium canescens]KAJ6041423.1 hypothetical protein N7460_006813 [Penicillium canescens]KAJ6050578.1 hypothetical protein N7446_010687 [Penicillium canescens]KAJ6065797.1 hypothetical protein N7444_001450 [Penicillium canescens]